ncbi:histidine triad nucleotide-binding protein [Thermosediminibacter oceani]|uniref:Histidine triad (HIT) protein n=1 Tax=Thermosediminibacter oceani (strain ATCC BAA-1034 / DSM 16646 / JW/IW-1228P) TaxID=555079 RepID=D9S2P9_THEOJ|nr:histidine triad nucleotide-binding protein [Thermosediminibacter oceani]ADL07676.1 histidine triad (HIT) protein [Thermosediminibacter oceani DSM 16646]
MDCIFCKIVRKEVPAAVVYEDNDILAFKDINPQAPIHLLIIPKQHLTSIMDIDDSNGDIVKKILLVAKNLARKNNIDNKGFRLVVNTGNDGGQTVHHLHFHLLGGRFMTWPPG